MEGSSEIDNGVGIFPGGNGSADTGSSDLDENDGEGGEGGTQTTDPNDGEDEDEGEGQRTEKGTKLDPNPQSAINQQLANERRVRLQYEKVLSDPELLKRYAKEAGISIAEAKEEIKDEVKAFTPDRFKTREDVANAFNEMQTTFNKTLTDLRKENESLRGRLDKSEGSSRLERVATTMERDVQSIRGKYSELNPTLANGQPNPDYDAELDKEIGSLYKDIDFDEETGSFRGQFSLAKIADRVMKAAGRAGQRSSDRTKTNIVVKRSGKVVTSEKSTNNEGSESKDPATTIAQRIAKAMSK